MSGIAQLRRKTAVKAPPPAPRTHRPQETRAAILAAAARIFGESGLEGPRMEAIAAAACVNKAMLYYYFTSKDLLYSAVLESYFQQWHRLAMQVLSSGAPARSILLRFVETHFDFISSHREYPMLFQRLMMTGAGSMERLIRKYFMPISGELVAVIERGQRSGELRQADSHHAAISIVALNAFYFSAARIVGIITNLDPYSSANLKRRKQAVLQFIRYGLFSDPEEDVA